jgi:hypothetical protein
MLTYAGLCWQKLTYARWADLRWRGLRSSVSSSMPRWRCRRHDAAAPPALTAAAAAAAAGLCVSLNALPSLSSSLFKCRQRSQQQQQQQQQQVRGQQQVCMGHIHTRHIRSSMCPVLMLLCSRSLYVVSYYYCYISTTTTICAIHLYSGGCRSSSCCFCCNSRVDFAPVLRHPART